MTSPLVSIIIPFYNDPLVGSAIQSALLQTYPRKEIIVVNDGSTAHLDLLAPYLRLPGVYLCDKQNGGTASALNAGIRIAAGDYIAWLSSDDQFTPDKLRKQMEFMMDTQSSISFTNFDVMDASGSIVSRAVMPRYASYAEFCQAFGSYCPVNGCTVVASRQLLLSLGVFNESLPYTHDYDLWFRVLLSGARFRYLHEPLLKYRVHDAMGSVRHAAVIEQEAADTRRRWWPLLQAMIHSLPPE